MPTTVVKTIGTSSRDYSTLQTWEDASPSNLTTARSNNCTGGTTSTIVLDVGASGTNDFYAGHAVTNASSEQRLITAYNGTTKIATIGSLNGSSATWTAPTTGQAFVIDSVIWQGQAYNDSEFVQSVGSSYLLTISGETTDATRYLELTCGSGQSFQDNASVRTNALKYNQSNGVGVRASVSYGRLISCTVANTRLSKLQLKATTFATLVNFGSGSTGALIKDVIGEATGEENGGVFRTSGGSSIVVNVLVFITGTGGGAFKADIVNGTTYVGCTAIRSSDRSAAGTAFVVTYTGNVLQSCASFGFSTPASATGWTNSKNNATDQSSGLPGTSNQVSVTFSGSTPFTNSANGSQNSIPVTGTALSANGFLDATNAPNDITGTVRAASPTIGVWELVAAASNIFGLSSLDGLSTSGKRQFRRVE